uniref:DUF1768 domain-containing protein n=1 Tax=Globodera pallida TaxID=36090 RepID=A0A183BN76_GLOPA
MSRIRRTPNIVTSRDGSMKLAPFFTDAFVFSNHFVCRFVVEGLEFCCTEQFYMYFKAQMFGDEESASAIIRSTNPKEIKRMGAQIRLFDTEKWRQVSILVMTVANWMKYQQNAELRIQLLSTAGSLLVEAAPNDNYWGIGNNIANAQDVQKWNGKNVMGRILTKIRDNFLSRNVIHSTTTVIQHLKRRGVSSTGYNSSGRPRFGEEAEKFEGKLAEEFGKVGISEKVELIVEYLEGQLVKVWTAGLPEQSLVDSAYILPPQSEFKFGTESQLEEGKGVLACIGEHAPWPYQQQSQNVFYPLHPEMSEAEIELAEKIMSAAIACSFEEEEKKIIDCRFEGMHPLLVDAVSYAAYEQNDERLEAGRTAEERSLLTASQFPLPIQSCPITLLNIVGTCRQDNLSHSLTNDQQTASAVQASETTQAVGNEYFQLLKSGEYHRDRFGQLMDSNWRLVGDMTNGRRTERAENNNRPSAKDDAHALL